MFCSTRTAQSKLLLMITTTVSLFVAIQHSNAEANTARMQSQPGRRKNPYVVQSRSPKTSLNQTECHNARTHVRVATQNAMYKAHN